MNPARRILVPVFKAGATAILVVAGGCVGAPDPDAGSDPLVVTESMTAGSKDTSPERAAAIAEMRAKAAAAQGAEYPAASSAERTNRLARREEPRSVADSDAIQLELEAVSQRRALATKPGEIAAMERRAAELRRLAATAKATTAGL